MKYKLGVGVSLAALVGALGWHWWSAEPVKQANNAIAVPAASSSPQIAGNDVTSDMTPPSPAKAASAKESADQCWQALEKLQTEPDSTDTELFSALTDALSSGASLQQLVTQTPAEQSGTYLRQLMFAQRFQQFTELGYAAEITNVEDDPQLAEYLNGMPEKERQMTQMEQVADKHFQQITERVDKLASLDEQEFSEQVSDMQLSSGDFVGLMMRGVSYDKLALLLDHVPAEQLATYPLVVNFASTIPFFNIADYAAYSLDVPMLQLLAKRGVYPSQIDGLIGPIERALAHRRWGENDTDNTLNAVTYLVENGYKIATTTDETGEKFGSRAFSSDWVTVDERVKNYILSQHATQPAVAEAPTATNEVVERIISARESLSQQQQDAFAQCRSLDAERLDAEQLWSSEQVYGQINSLMAQYQGDALLDALQALDPSLVSVYRDNFANRVAASHYQQLREAMTQRDSATALSELLQTTPLDAADTAIVLMQLPYNPNLVPSWNNRIEPVAPLTLSGMTGIKADGLNELLAQGFDLYLQDEQNNNLYSVFFTSSPELVAQLLQAQVDPFSNRYGPDALDYALDKSYADNQLFPGINEILQACVSLEPNHQRRLARLKLFRPELYQQLLAIDPALKVGDDVQPNTMLSFDH